MSPESNLICQVLINVFFFKQKTAYEIVDCDWSSDVCSSDLIGRVVLGAAKIEQTAEKVTNAATAFTGTINFDVITQSIFNATSNASANWTLNVRGDGSNSLNNIMDTGESLTIVTLVPQGSTAYYNSAFQIDGSSVTPKWQDGATPSAGNASSTDIYSYTIIKTANATFTVIAAQTKFA